MVVVLTDTCAVAYCCVVMLLSLGFAQSLSCFTKGWRVSAWSGHLLVRLVPQLKFWCAASFGVLLTLGVLCECFVVMVEQSVGDHVFFQSMEEVFLLLK